MTLAAVRDLAEHRRRFSPERRFARGAGPWPPKARLHPGEVDQARRDRLEWAAERKPAERLVDRGVYAERSSWTQAIDRL